MFELEWTSIDLLSAAVAVQRRFIAAADPQQAFEEALELLLQSSESEFGTIGRVLRSPQGKPFFQTYVISNTAWDEASRALYEANAPGGLEFHNLQSLFGEVIRTNAVVISNTPADDPRSGGFPTGYPPLESFLGVPFLGANGEILGMAALANRLGGYDDNLVAQLEPLCDAVGVMIAAAQCGQCRREAEQALRDSEERFRALVGACAQAVWETGPDGEVIADSPSWRAFTGQTLDEWMGDRWLEAVHPEDREFALRQWSDAIRSGTLVNVEFRIRNPEGHWRWSNVRAAPLRELDGSVRKWVGMNIDVTERREAEQTLRDSEERFRALVDASSQIVWTADADGKVVEDSPSWRAYTGQTYDKYRGNGWLEMVHPDDRGRIANEWRQFQARQANVDYEHRLWHAESQRWRWTNVRAVCLRNPDGSARSWIGMIIDIDQRKRAEETIRQIVKVTAPKTGQDFFRILVGQLSRACHVAFALVAEIDPTDHNLVRTIAVSHHGDLIDNFTYDLRDTPCENVVGKSMCHYATGVQGKFPKDELLNEMGIDSYLGLPLFASTGQPLGLIVLLHTRPIDRPEQARAILPVVAARAGAELERRQAEEALKERERDFRLFSLSTGDCFWNWDMVAGTVERSSGFARSFGYSEQEILSGIEWWAERIHPEDKERVLKVFNAAVAGDQSICGYEYRFRCQDSSYAIVDDHVCLIRNSTGKVVRSLGAMQDITDWKRAEEELAERQAELLHASRLSTVGRMLAALSHEVAQPLSAIGNFAAASERILDAKPNDQWETLREHIHAIAEQNQRCGAILQRLRDFSRRTAPTRSPCDICQLLHDSVELVASELRRNGVEVRFKFSESLPHVLGDRIQLQQVVVNLLTNARDAMHDQPEQRRVITIRAIAEDDAIQFDVEDLGTGVADHASARLFEPFFTTKKHGMGIGLSICRSIIEDHGGRIDASSNSSGGARFRVRLPSVEKDQ